MLNDILKIDSLDPYFIDQNDVHKICERDFLQIFLAMKNVKLNVGLEHSLFVHEKFSTAFKNDIPFTELLPTYLNEGRFTTDHYLFDIMTSKTIEGLGSRPLTLPIFEKTSIEHKIFDMRCFAGKAKQKSSLHFDWNIQSNLLINLVGRKEIILFPPTASAFLKGYSNFYPPDLPLPTDVSPKRFVLGPGEGLLIPPLWWHQAIYLEDACSLSIRFKIYETPNSWALHLYPSWKIPFLYGVLGSVETLKFFNSSSTEDMPTLEKFEKIESKLNVLLKNENFDRMEHPLYKYWACGYLHYKNVMKEFDP